MTIKLIIKRPHFGIGQPSLGAEKGKTVASPTQRPFIDSLAECGGAADIQMLRNQKVDRNRPLGPAVAPEPIKCTPTDASVGRGALSWLRKMRVKAAVKRIRLIDTVSLGEKRFVAILHVDDHEFLIGGGPTGVALLSQLDVATPAEVAPGPRSVAHLQGFGQ